MTEEVKKLKLDLRAWTDFIRLLSRYEIESGNHIKTATLRNRREIVTEVLINRTKEHPNQVYFTIDNGFGTWRDPINFQHLLPNEETKYKIKVENHKSP